MKRRVLTAVLAIVLAVLGTAGVLAYVHKADSRALAGMSPVSVLVAQGQIPAGTSADSAQQLGLLRSERLPASSVPANAVRSITGVGSLVMSEQVPPGQVLLRPMLVTAAQATAAGALAIPKGMVAVTIPVCLFEAVAGYVQPGSQVAVFDTYPLKKGVIQTSCDQSGASHQGLNLGGVITRMLLPRVLVVATGQAPTSGTASTGTSTTASGSAFSHGAQTDPAASTAAGSVLVTLAVSQANAERLILVTRVGLPYLALLTSSSQTGFDTGLQPLFQR